MTTTLTTFTAAAQGFSSLVHTIPSDAWDGPGLGEWDLRSLVGHTVRAMTTVVQYLDRPAAVVDVDSAAEYYSRARAAVASGAITGIVERGREAGRALGPDPVATVDAQVVEVLEKLDDGADRPILVAGDMGMRLHDYLPTRTFELAVHSLDIAAAAGLDFELPPAVLAETTVLAARIAVELGSGVQVLTALSGRTDLPSGFSVV